MLRQALMKGAVTYQRSTFRQNVPCTRSQKAYFGMYHIGSDSIGNVPEQTGMKCQIWPKCPEPNTVTAHCDTIHALGFMQFLRAIRHLPH